MGRPEIIEGIPVQRAGRLSLSEIFQLYQKRHGNICIPPKIRGIVQCTLRGPDGKIKQQICEENTITAGFIYKMVGESATFDSIYIFMSNEKDEIHYMKGLVMDSYTDAAYNTITPSTSRDTTNMLWTFSGQSLGITAQRTIRIVGLKFGSEAVFSTYLKTHGYIVAAKRLSSDIIQGTLDTFEVVYKIYFTSGI